jgi:hypothetical protein
MRSPLPADGTIRDQRIAGRHRPIHPKSGCPAPSRMMPPATLVPFPS